MTDKEIIKALECCCESELKVDCQKLKCPFFDNEIYNCMNVDNENAMYRYSLDLINRQQAEIENYIKVAEYQQNLTLKKSFEIKELKAEIERLEELATEKQNLMEQWQDEAKQLLMRNGVAKAEAIKEFAERLKKRGFADKHYEHESIVYVADIDNLVKEMVGDEEWKYTHKE